MSYKINNGVIFLTRGDTLKLTIGILDADGNPYIPVEGDIIKFGLKKTANDEEILIEKEIPYDTCLLHLKPEDTKSLAFGKYKYDISIQFTNGDVNTFITSSIFKLTEEIG